MNSVIIQYHGIKSSHVYSAIYIKIVSKQLHSDEQENNSVNVIKLKFFEINSTSAISSSTSDNSVIIQLNVDSIHFNNYQCCKVHQLS